MEERPRGGRPTVVVADDHTVVRVGVRLILASDDAFEVVGEATDVASTIRAVETHRPSILLLDLHMPDGLSLDALPAILSASPETRVVALTMQEGPGFAARAFSAGAHGYVLKEAVETELLSALQTVAAGRKFLDPRVGAAAVSDLPLSEREQAVLRLLALGSTNAQIAQRLSFSERTIEACRAQIRQKLGVSDRATLTEYAHSHGLLERPPRRPSETP
ncbi:MAG TPA: response regulator transcription factor [Thermoleophilaceae bacterium]|nr:response regulator transcription factor [Thermoleophilaceae bacterium]